MPLEICDTDYIWNHCKIIKKEWDTNMRTKITVQYDGWNSDWNEEIDWPCNRLARIFTYTKKAKCFIPVLLNSKNSRLSNITKDDKNWTGVWPCKVYFRMPHPGKDSARDHLRREGNIYFEPYMPTSLPSYEQEQLRAHNPSWEWFVTHEVRPWINFDSWDKKKLTMTVDGMAYHVTRAFRQAYQAGISDEFTAEFPPNVLLKGSALLKEDYRVHEVGGDLINGVRYSGAIPSADNIREYKKKNQQAASSRGRYDQKNQEARKAPFNPPPTLPRPILIKHTAYVDQDVRHLPASNQWTGILRVSGNEIFIGPFDSQSKAVKAVKMAKLGKRIAPDESGSEGACGPIDDLMNIPIESIVSAFEETQRKSSSSRPQFRLRDWTAQRSRHVKEDFNISDYSFVDVQRDDYGADGSNKRRKKSVPKRLVRVS